MRTQGHTTSGAVTGEGGASAFARDRGPLDPGRRRRVAGPGDR